MSIGLSTFSFIDQRDKKQAACWLNACLNDQVSSAMIENRLISRSGETHDMMWTVNFHYDQQGNIEYINSIAQDLTERKHAEEEKAKLEEKYHQAGLRAPCTAGHEQRVSNFAVTIAREMGLDAEMILSSSIPVCSCLRGTGSHLSWII